MFNVANRSTPRPHRLRPILALAALLGLLSACIIVPAYGRRRTTGTLAVVLRCPVR